MTHLPLENPNRLVSSPQSIEICACYVSPNCRSSDNAINRIFWSIDRQCAQSTILVDRSTSCLSLCAHSRYLILQGCCHVSPNTRALNASNDFFSCFFASRTENTRFYLKVLQNTERPKLTKKSENNKAKGLINAN
jgi:hypothetical protein